MLRAVEDALPRGNLADLVKRIALDRPPARDGGRCAAPLGGTIVIAVRGNEPNAATAAQLQFSSQRSCATGCAAQRGATRRHMFACADAERSQVRRPNREEGRLVQSEKLAGTCQWSPSPARTGVEEGPGGEVTLGQRTDWREAGQAGEVG